MTTTIAGVSDGHRLVVYATLSGLQTQIICPHPYGSDNGGDVPPCHYTADGQPNLYCQLDVRTRDASDAISAVEDVVIGSVPITWGVDNDRVWVEPYQPEVVLPEAEAHAELAWELLTSPTGTPVGWWGDEDQEYILAATSSPDAALQAAEWLCQRDKRMPLTHYWGGQPSVEQHQVVWISHQVDGIQTIAWRSATDGDPYRDTICIVIQRCAACEEGGTSALADAEVEPA